MGRRNGIEYGTWNDMVYMEDGTGYQIICLATLIAGGELPVYATLEDGKKYFRKMHRGCLECPLCEKCLVFRMEE